MLPALREADPSAWWRGESSAERGRIVDGERCDGRGYVMRRLECCCWVVGGGRWWSLCGLISVVGGWVGGGMML